MKVNPTEIARQMRKNGEDLKTTGEEWVRLGEQQIKLADKLEGSVMVMSQIVALTNNGHPPDAPKINITRQPTSKLTIAKACEMVLRQRGTPMHKRELYETIVRNGCKARDIRSMMMTMSRRGSNFKSLGNGVWTLNEEKVNDPMKLAR